MTVNKAVVDRLS